LTRQVLFPSAYITGPAKQWVVSYIARSPEAQVKLWDRQIHAEDENSKGPAKRNYYEQYYGDGSSVAETTAGSWVREGVLAGISPLECEYHAKLKDLILSSRDRHPFPGQEDLVDEVQGM
jgi:hypothetical protein